MARVRIATIHFQRIVSVQVPVYSFDVIIIRVVLVRLVELSENGRVSIFDDDTAVEDFD